MSKKIQAIIIGAIVIILLGGAITALTITKKPDKANKESSTQDTQVITLIENESGKLEYAKVKNTFDEYTIESLGENKWGIKALDGFAQVDKMYTETVGSLANIYANEIVEENSKDLAKFGFDKPSLVVEIKYKGKEPFKITLGDVSPDTQSRYAIKTGEKTVYALSTSTLSKLLQSRYDYVEKTLVPALEAGKDGKPIPPTIQHVNISRPDLEKPITLQEYKTGELSENAVTSMNVGMVSPVNAMINEEETQKCIYALFGLAATKVEFLNPKAEDLTKYGFDKPTSVFEMTYNKTSSAKIKTGNLINSKAFDDKKETAPSYYAMVEGKNIVYVLSKESITWLEPKAKQFMSAIAVLPPILDIDSVNLTVGGKPYLIEYIKGKDKTDTKEIKAKLNGKDADVDNAKKLLQLLYMTSVQDVNKIVPTKPADATIKYNYTSKKVDVVDFYVLEDRQIIISLNGNYAYVGRAGYVDKVAKEVLNFANGKAVDTDW